MSTKKTIRLKAMSAGDVAALREMAAHCERLGELMDSLSLDVKDNLMTLTDGDEENIFSVGIFAEFFKFLVEAGERDA